MKDEIDKSRGFCRRGFLSASGVATVLGGAIYVGYRGIGAPNIKAKWCGPAAAGAFQGGRSNVTIDRIVIFTTEHEAEQAAESWRSAGTACGHYIVTQSGDIWQFVHESDAAFHAGNRNFNLRSIGIAVEGLADLTQNESSRLGKRCLPPRQLHALAGLIRLLCKQFGIPPDRRHILGKNQVPGVVVPALPLAGPLFWGGASNKFAPGPFWDWRMLMEALGRSRVATVHRAICDVDILTLPFWDAPAITRLWKDQCVVIYDETDEFCLAFVVGKGYKQPNLLRGDYHWDGWVPKQALRASKGVAFRVTSPGSPRGCVAYQKRRGGKEFTSYGWIPNNKCVAGAGATLVTSSTESFHEVFVYDSQMRETVWIDAQSCRMEVAG